MRGPAKSLSFPTGRTSALAFAAIVACCLSFPHLAFASVVIDQTELAQGENAIGGGTATLANTALDMVGVKAIEFYTNENLTVNFNGGNDIEYAVIGGSAQVEMNFAGENSVEDIVAAGNSNATINANGHNDFEEVSAFNNSNVTINVAGENDFESIRGFDNASITIQGTTCQKRDIIDLGDGEDDTFLATENADLTIDHATVNLKGETATVGSGKGNVRIDTSKIAKDDGNEYAYITAGGTMLVRESVIDITGTVHSKGEMTIEHSDVKVKEPDPKYHDESPYRIYSETGIKLINEKNGTVKKGTAFGDDVFFVDTDDNDGKEVDLKADGQPAYYRCKDDDNDTSLKALPRTGDKNNPIWPLTAGIMSAATAAYASRRRSRQ